MPKVSIIIPCYNEQRTIRLLLDALRNQTFPYADAEVIISDGMSTDSTRAEIALFQNDYPDLTVRVVDNALRSIPSAVNRALEVSRGEMIVRLDAHSKPHPDYVERCVKLLEAGAGDNVEPPLLELSISPSLSPCWPGCRLKQQGPCQEYFLLLK